MNFSREKRGKNTRLHKINIEGKMKDTTERCFYKNIGGAMEVHREFGGKKNNLVKICVIGWL